MSSGWFIVACAILVILILSREWFKGTLCVLAFLAGFAIGSTAKAEPLLPLSSPVKCTTGFTVSQRMDTWGRVRGELRIVKSKWNRACLNANIAKVKT